jgi:hypothetical protein
MQQHQRGMTFLGVLILMCFIGTFIYAVIRLTPAYLEYFEISKTFGALQVESAGTMSPGALRVTLEKRFDIDDVTSLDPKDVEIKRDGDVWIVRGVWDVKEPFIGNVSFLVHFDKMVTLKPS